MPTILFTDTEKRLTDFTCCVYARVPAWLTKADGPAAQKDRLSLATLIARASSVPIETIQGAQLALWLTQEVSKSRGDFISGAPTVTPEADLFNVLQVTMARRDDASNAASWGGNGLDQMEVWLPWSEVLQRGE